MSHFKLESSALQNSQLRPCIKTHLGWSDGPRKFLWENIPIENNYDNPALRPSDLMEFENLTGWIAHVFQRGKKPSTGSRSTAFDEIWKRPRMAGVPQDILAGFIFRLGFTQSVFISILFEAFNSLSLHVIMKIVRLPCSQWYSTNSMTHFKFPKWCASVYS